MGYSLWGGKRIRRDLGTKQQHIHICVCVYTYIEYYSAKQKNKILPFEATWMDIEGITLNEISQVDKDKYWMLSFT